MIWICGVCRNLKPDYKNSKMKEGSIEAYGDLRSFRLELPTIEDLYT
jgi:hypothetical protein